MVTKGEVLREECFVHRVMGSQDALIVESIGGHMVFRIVVSGRERAEYWLETSEAERLGKSLTA